MVITPTYEHYDEMLFLLGDDEPRMGISTIRLESQMEASTSSSTKQNRNQSKSVTSSADTQMLNEVVKRALQVLDESSESDAVQDYIKGLVNVIESNFRRLNTKVEVDNVFLEITGVFSKAFNL